MSNAPVDSSAKPDVSASSTPAFSYKGPVSGLKGLLSSAAAAVSDLATKNREGGTERIPVEKIYPCPDQPRQVFEPKALEELSQTMREVGQAQAITVRRTPQGYEIIAGERRYRAAKLAGISELDCVVKDCTAREARLLALVENTQRQDLLPVEEAFYLKKVLEENEDMSLERLARVLGSHKSTLSEKIQLTEVPDDLQATLYSRGRSLTHRHWRVISRIPDPGFLREVFTSAIENQLSVADLEKSLAAAGVSKAVRRKASEGGETLPKADKALGLMRFNDGVVRFKTGIIELSTLTPDTKARLLEDLERLRAALTI